MLLAETVSHYGDEELQEMDEEGDIAMLVDEVAEGMSRCLAEGQPDSETRRRWLEALLEGKLTDIALGGVDLAPSAWNALLEQATDTDWSWIEQRVRSGDREEPRLGAGDSGHSPKRTQGAHRAG